MLTTVFLLEAQKRDLFAPHGAIKSTLRPAGRKSKFVSLVAQYTTLLETWFLSQQLPYYLKFIKVHLLFVWLFPTWKMIILVVFFIFPVTTHDGLLIKKDGIYLECYSSLCICNNDDKLELERWFEKCLLWRQRKEKIRQIAKGENGEWSENKVLERGGSGF